MGEHIIKLPDVGEGVAEAELVEWLVKVGDLVREDTMLAAVMTDKATVEIPSPVDGEVTWLGAEAGETVAVGSPIVRLKVPDRAAPPAKPAAPPSRPGPEPVRAAAPPTPKPYDPIMARLTAPSHKSPPEPGTAEAVLALLNSPADPFSLDWSLDPKPKAEPVKAEQARIEDLWPAPIEKSATEPKPEGSTPEAPVEATPEETVDAATEQPAADQTEGVVVTAQAAEEADPMEAIAPEPLEAAAPESVETTAQEPIDEPETRKEHDELDAVLAAVKAAAAAHLPGMKAEEPEPETATHAENEAPESEEPASETPTDEGEVSEIVAALQETVVEADAEALPAEASAAEVVAVADEGPAEIHTPPGVPRAEGEKPLASPAVRMRAREAGIDLRRVRGSGPAGQISHEDLDRFLGEGDAPPTPAPAAAKATLARNLAVQDIKVIGLRRKIAEKMKVSKSRIPHITYIEEVDVTAIEDLRAALNKSKRSDRPKLTILPFLMRAMVKAIAEQPGMNALFDDDAGIVHRHGAVHIGVAAQTAAGLVVPVVRHAEARDLWDCAEEVNRVAEAAKAGSATREELSGSTITITSLGALGGIATTPVINHPEVAIIGVNKMMMRPMWDGSQFVPRKMMNLSSSFDHRVVDGLDAAVFIQRIKGLLENPAMIFIDE